MNESPDLLDTAYEYAGFQAAGSFHEALSGLSVPLLFALAGVAYRVFRVAEDGAVRPMAFHMLTLFLMAWLVSPRSSDPSALPHLRAPRALAMIDAAADAVVRRAIDGVDKDFLTRPFEWERLALLAGVSRIQDANLADAATSFLEECSAAAMLRAGSPPPDGARRNPLADDSGLKYEGLVDASGRSCETLRRALVDALRREVESQEVHREALVALSAYDGGGGGDLREAYIDKLVRNHWRRPDASQGEFELAARSVGTYRWIDSNRKTLGLPVDGGRSVNSILDLITFPVTALAEVGTSIFAQANQWMSDATESKQRQYLLSTHAPHLYGLTIMLLMSLFPLAGLYALLPGKWTALLQFSKLFFSVKLWPFGWALLTAFTQRRPSAMALADASSDLRAPLEQALRIGESPSIFVSVSLLYVLVPALAFVAVQLVSHAASLPFQAAMPRPAGGNPAAAAGQAASALAA